MMVDKQDINVMKDNENNKKILDAICKFYKLNTVLYNFQEQSGIFLRTTKNNSIVTVSKLNYLGSFCLFDSINDLVETVLNLANFFEVYEDGKKVACIKNVFLGCKTLEDVLITRDLHSNK